jgi:hypothetical protein
MQRKGKNLFGASMIARLGRLMWPRRSRASRLRCLGADAIAPLGCQTVEDLAGQLLGDPLPAVLLAQRGDLLLGGPERALGVCVGSEGRFLTEAGLTCVPLRACAMGWRI